MSEDTNNYVENQIIEKDFSNISEENKTPAPQVKQAQKTTLAEAVKNNRTLWRKVKTAYTKRIVADVENGGSGSVAIEKFIQELINDGLERWK